ncbi:MAG: bifunctional riboflavin kinase/FAD synthetase [Bacteroidia bacterium]
MKVYRDLTSITEIKNPVLTIGTFDGVHQGHRAIIKKVNEIAREIDGESVLLTFYPHPRKVLFGDDSLKLINTVEEKAELLEEEGIKHFIVHPFTREFSRLNAFEYVRDIIVSGIAAKVVVVGYDHHFGRNREGGMEQLKEYAKLFEFEIYEIPAEQIDNVKVSSTKIRTAIEEGNIEQANTFLTRPFSLWGIVVKGDELGRTMGFPTANMQLSKEKILPKDGVYAVDVIVKGNKLRGMMNIGVRPTVNISDEQRVEVNIFDFNQDIYGENIKVEVLKKIRNEKQFATLDELKSQIQNDKLMALNV